MSPAEQTAHQASQKKQEELDEILRKADALGARELVLAFWKRQNRG